MDVWHGIFIGILGTLGVQRVVALIPKLVDLLRAALTAPPHPSNSTTVDVDSAPDELLAEVVHDPDKARVLLTRVGYPRSEVPAWKNAQTFWSDVLAEVRSGVPPGEVRLLLEAAASMYPYHSALAKHRSTSSGP